MKEVSGESALSKMIAVVQIYVEGYLGEEVKSILNPRIGDLNEWTGSGFFIDNIYEQGLIVTNAHVVRNSKSIQVLSMLTSEEKFDAELVGNVKNQDPDIALIKLKAGELKRFKEMTNGEIPTLLLKTSNDITRGSSIKAIGYPMGMNQPNITGGEITNFISGNRISSEKYVTDAAINPGNSGGPALDENGEVIGVNTSIYQEAENIGFITPSSFVSIIMRNIFENNSICFTDLGGNLQKNSTFVSESLHMSAPMGVIVCSTDKGGMLEQAGIKEEDVILEIDGKTIDRHGLFIDEGYFHRRNIFDALKLIPIGKQVEFLVWRNEQTLKLSGQALAFPEKKIESKAIMNERYFLDIWGMTVQVLSYEIIESFGFIDSQVLYSLLKNFNDNKERLIVTHIEKEGITHKQEWAIGEVLVTFDDIQILGMSHLIDLVTKSSNVCKIKTELGAIGFFNCQIDTPKLQEPSSFFA